MCQLLNICCTSTTTENGAHVLDDDRTHFPGFNVCKHGLKTGSLKVRAGITVVGVPAQVGKAILFCKGFEYPFLRRDLSRYVFAKECAIRIDKQQKECYNNAVIDNGIII